MYTHWPFAQLLPVGSPNQMPPRCSTEPPSLVKCIVSRMRRRMHLFQMEQLKKLLQPACRKARRGRSECCCSPVSSLGSSWLPLPTLRISSCREEKARFGARLEMQETEFEKDIMRNSSE